MCVPAEFIACAGTCVVLALAVPAWRAWCSSSCHNPIFPKQLNAARKVKRQMVSPRIVMITTFKVVTCRFFKCKETLSVKEMTPAERGNALCGSLYYKAYKETVACSLILFFKVHCSLFFSQV
jgi:hypothetical protein